MRESLGPHLPLLRRHARALAGSQRSGDAYVRQALETLLTAPDGLVLNDNIGPRLALFRLFHSVSPATHFVGPTALAKAGLPALLLTEVEGFSVADVAYILAAEPDDIAGSIEQARAAIADTIRSRVLIIEDEPLIAMHLEQIVEDMGHEVSAMAMTHSDAVQQAHEVAPELVLADIQLADGSSGLDAVREILQTYDVPVVFITAYPERLLTGERPEPTFLVTKPFNVETVVATIGQALLTRQFKTAAAA